MKTVTVYPNRNFGWSNFVNSHAIAGQPAAYTDKSIVLVIQTSPFPTNVGANYADLIAGAYDAHWRQVGTLLKERQAKGFAPAILSPAWEMNGTYFYWGGGTGPGKYASPAQYVQGFRRLVEQVRSTFPEAKIAWTINGHATPSETGTSDAMDLYPGDAYVSYLGIDDYDHYPAAPTRQAFNARATANGGVEWIAAQARKRGKKLIVPEWGVAPGSGVYGGGDNANYIQWMFETFWAWHAEDLLVSEFYFADPAGSGNVDSDLMGSNPLARARYVSLWREGANALITPPAGARQATPGFRLAGAMRAGLPGAGTMIIAGEHPPGATRWHDLRGASVPLK